MSRSTIFVLAAFFILLVGSVVYHFWPHFAVNTSKITNYPSKGTDIIAFGDSLVAGYGADGGHNFVTQLSNAISEPIINLGVDGDTTESALARISVFDKYNPKVVIVLVGGNDYLQKKDMTVAFENLGKIIDNLQKKGAVVLLVGVRVNYFIGNYDKQYEQLVDKYKVAYVPDVMDGIFGSKTLMFDSIHPNDAGYKIIADRIEPALKEVVK